MAKRGKQGLGPASLASAVAAETGMGHTDFILHVHPDAEADATALISDLSTTSGRPLGIGKVEADVLNRGDWWLEAVKKESESPLLIVSSDPDQEARPALILGRDGTVAFSAREDGKVLSPADIRLYDDVERVLWRWRAMGYIIVLVSNVDEIATGEITEDDLADIHRAFVDLFEENPFHLQYYNTANEEGTVEPHNRRSLLRKPGYGMLVLAEEDAFNAGFLLDWNNSLVVGTEDDDETMAQAAGITFNWAADFFNRVPPVDRKWEEDTENHRKEQEDVETGAGAGEGRDQEADHSGDPAGGGQGEAG